MRYEYIRIELDFGDLQELNQLSSYGWKVISVNSIEDRKHLYWVLLERPLGKRLVEHIVGERGNTVVLRTLTRDQARDEILTLFKSANEPLFYSDIAHRLGLDLEQVLEITSELEREGIVGELGRASS